MLVLSRKLGEKIVIGNGITITVVKIKGNLVRLGIDAPDQVPILRSEITCWQDEAAGDAKSAECALLCDE